MQTHADISGLLKGWTALPAGLCHGKHDAAKNITMVQQEMSSAFKHMQTSK